LLLEEKYFDKSEDKEGGSHSESGMGETPDIQVKWESVVLESLVENYRL